MSFLEQLVNELFSSRLDSTNDEAARLRLFDASLAWSAVTSHGSEGPLSAVIESLFGLKASARSVPAARLIELAARGRATEVDDIHLASNTTPGMAVCSTVIALTPLAPRAPASRALQAISAGYEAMTRASTALGGPWLLARGIWPSRAVAPIGAAVAASTLLDLDLATTVEAVAIAAGWRCNAEMPEPSRELSFAEAVLVGATAAISAGQGMRGTPAALSDWEDQIAPDADDVQVHVSPKIPAILSTCIKPFCGSQQTLAATTALLELSQTASITAADVVAVRIAVPPMHLRRVDRPSVSNRLDTIGSMQYQVGLVFLHPKELFNLGRRPNVDDAMRNLMDRVEIRGDANLLDKFPEQWGASVEIVTADQTLSLRVDGATNERALDWEHLIAKGEQLFGRAGLSMDRLGELQSLTKDFCEVGALEDLGRLVLP